MDASGRNLRLSTSLIDRSEADRAAGALASTQHGLATRAQLGGLGFTRWMIESRRRRGLLVEVHPGVFAVGHPPATHEARWMAAVLACGAGAALPPLGRRPVGDPRVATVPDRRLLAEPVRLYGRGDHASPGGDARGGGPGGPPRDPGHRPRPDDHRPRSRPPALGARVRDPRRRGEAADHARRARADPVASGREVGHSGRRRDRPPPRPRPRVPLPHQARSAAARDLPRSRHPRPEGQRVDRAPDPLRGTRGRLPMA